MSDAEMEKRRLRKVALKNHLKMAPNGVRESKLVVKDLIRKWILGNLPIEKVYEFIGMNGESEPTDNIMFEIMMYKYQQEYGVNAFTHWMENINYISRSIQLVLQERTQRHITSLRQNSSLHIIRKNHTE